MRPAWDSAVLDESVLADILALAMPGEPSALAEVTQLFVSCFPRDLHALRTAIAAKDLESAGQVAHRMRGSALGVGAIRVVPICAAVEDAARAGCLDRVVIEADGLGREFAFACLALEQASR
jgi:HPt (histidine-containing phosphotransfer) domain-containing protein